MKKSLLYLQSLLLTATPILTTVACNKTSKTTKDKLNPTNVLSKQEKEIIDNTSLFTKLLLLSRSENLNFNSTEVLNALYAPKTAWTAFARNYTLNGKTYNLNDYTETLASEYSNLAKLNATTHDPFLASTLTGMYEDKLYRNYVAQKANKKADIFGYFGDNFNINNITPTVKLSTDPNRKQLAWANFTGPLSKYLADHPILDYQHLEYGNGDPRYFYGRFIDAAIKVKSLDSEVIEKEDGTSETVRLEGLKVKDESKKINQEFGKYQANLYRNQTKANFTAKVLDFLPFIQNFNETASGAIYGLKFLNAVFPFTDSQTNMDIPHGMFLLLDVAIKWMWMFASKYKDNPKALAVLNKGNKINGNCVFDLCYGLGLFKDLHYNPLYELTDKGTHSVFKVQMLMDKEKDGKKIEFFNSIKEFRSLISTWVEEWKEGSGMKEAFLDHFKKQAGSLKNLTKQIKIEGLDNLLEEIINSLASPDDVISFFAVLGDMMSVIANNEKEFIAIAKNNKYENQDFNTLTKENQQNIATQLGLDEDNKFKKGSVLEGLYNVINDKTFNKTFLDINSPIYKYNSKNAKEIHEDLLQYALDNKYWKIDEKSFKLDGAISGTDSINGKFKYTIEYNGVGDKTVTKFLDQPVDLPNDFNPIEPWNTKTNTFKDWTFQDHIDHTGLGNKELYGNVNFKYNIEWSNVSGTPDFPY